MTSTIFDDAVQGNASVNREEASQMPEEPSGLNEISIIKFKMNKFKVAVMLAAKLTKNYTDGYLNAQREVMLTGLSLYGRLYDIGYVDRERYTKDVMDLVHTYERHLKEAPIIASIRQIRSTGRTPGIDLKMTAEERARYIGNFSVAATMNRVILEAQEEVVQPKVGGMGGVESPVDYQTAPVQPIRDEPLIDATQSLPRPLTTSRPHPSTTSRQYRKVVSQRGKKTVLDKISGWLQ